LGTSHTCSARLAQPQVCVGPEGVRRCRTVVRASGEARRSPSRPPASTRCERHPPRPRLHSGDRPPIDGSEGSRPASRMHFYRGGCTGDASPSFGHRTALPPRPLEAARMSARWGPFWGQRHLLKRAVVEGRIRTDRNRALSGHDVGVPEGEVLRPRGKDPPRHIGAWARPRKPRDGPTSAQLATFGPLVRPDLQARRLGGEPP